MRGLVLALLSLFIVNSDTGQYLPQILSNSVSLIERDGSPEAIYPLLWKGANQGAVDAKALLVSYAKQDQDPSLSSYWLDKLVSQNTPSAAWALYQQHRQDPSYVKYLKLAAQGGVAEAQLVYAMSVNEPMQRESWLLKSAQQDYVAAQTALADWYLLQHQPHKAKPWLAKTAPLDSQSAFKYGRLLWNEQSFDLAREWLNRSADRGNTQAKRFVVLISEYTPQASEAVSRLTWPTDKQCYQRIQLFATSLSTLSRADELYEKYKQDTRLAELPICTAPPLWLKHDVVACSDNYQGQRRLGCDIRPLAPAIERRDITHAVIVAEQGKANINNGVMYLDLSDAYSVFVHELAHFAGFIDEYPLSRMAARRYCSEADSNEPLPINPPNLVFDGQITYAPQSTLNDWLARQSSLVISESKTCESIGVRSYKPTGEMTFMEHHDLGVIPPLYLALWRAQLANPNTQRPISMNLFQGFHANGQQAKAGYWLDRYQNATKPIKEREQSTGTESAI